MNSPADNTNTFPGPPTRSFDPSAGGTPTASAESVGSLDAATSTASAGHTPTPTPTPLAIELPGYTCLMFLDKGGMGLVSLYHERQHDRQVAVKLCPIGADTRQTVINRFVREYETLQHLDHPNVVRVYQVDRIPGFVYYSMRYVPTGTLVRQETAVRASARTAVAFMRKVAAAVEYVHQRNVLHRDLKPGNILVDEAGEPLLADFGLAWTDDGHTTTLGGGPFGTPAYMAPEVVRHGPGGCTERSDIWAVGVILYELLAGCRPFVAEKNDTAKLYRLIQHAPPPPIHDSAAALPDVDERLETICLKCLAKSPAHRYQSAGELADDLQRWLDGQPLAPSAQPDAPDVRSAAELPPAPEDMAPTVTVEEPKPPARWQPKVAAAALVAVLLTAAVLSVVLWPTPPVKKSLIERLNAPGKRVVFIGETGKPVEEVGPLNGFDGIASVGVGGRYELGTAKNYFVELGNEPLPFPFRFEADVAILPSEGRPHGGIYSGRQEHQYPGGKPIQAACVNCIALGEAAANNPQVRLFNSVAAGPATFAPPDGTIDADAFTAFRPVLPGWQRTTPADPIDKNANPGPFHHLVIERVAGVYRMTRDTLPCGVLDIRKQRLFGDGMRTQDGLVLTAPTFANGFGLFAAYGGVQFRNVWLTRLRDPE
jgi:hypothetical protein